MLQLYKWDLLYSSQKGGQKEYSVIFGKDRLPLIRDVVVQNDVYDLMLFTQNGVRK